ncbi:MAG: TetR family transcriptional regulator [Myxococcota bacterium]
MTSRSSARKSPPARKRTAREQARDARKAAYQVVVLKAAGDAFARQGVPQTKMEDLADEAGISLGTLYTVYKGKAEIVDALHASRLQEIHSASVTAEMGQANPMDALLAGSRAYLTYFMEHPDYLRMYLDEGVNWGVRLSMGRESQRSIGRESQRSMGRESQSTMGRESRRAAVWADGVAQFAKIVERGIAEGLFEAGPPNRLARMMLAMQQVRLADWFEDGMKESPDELMVEIEALVRRTFCNPAHSAKPEKSTNKPSSRRQRKSSTKNVKEESP